MTFKKMKETDGRDNRKNGRAVDQHPEKMAKQVPKLGAPPDGGWGWVVAFSSFSISLLVDGVCFSFGIFFDDFRNEFKSSKATTSWIGSVLNGSYMLVGPIVSALVNIYGCRRVAIVGAVLSSIAFFCSTYSNNIGILILTFGLIGGIGFGFMYLPAIVIVGYYFERRRALATGIACCGSGIGAFLFAPFCEYLLNQYGWRGAIWILSGLVLNGLMFAMFYRPLPGPVMEEVQSEPPSTMHSEMVSVENELGQTPSVVVMVSDADGSLQGVNNEISMDAAPQNTPSTTTASTENPDKLMLSHSSTHEHTFNNLLTPNAHPVGKNVTPGTPANTPNSSDYLLEPSTGLYRTRSVTLSGAGKISDNDDTFRADVLRMTKSQDFTPTFDPMTQEKKHPVRVELPYLQRKDIFYGGSLMHLKEFKELGSIAEFRREMTSTSPSTTSPQHLSTETRSGETTHTHTTTTTRPTMKDALSSIFDFHLLKSPTFLVYGMACLLCMAGFFVPFIYMPGYALDLGQDTQSAAFLISIIGITNTVGRVAVGFISDQPWADCLLINNVALMVGGLVTMFVPFFQHYYVLAIYSAVFGTSIAVFVSLRSIIMVELLGLERLTTAFGFVIMFQGLSSFVGSPIAGALSDYTGNYDAAFYMAGITLFLSGVICLPLRWVARWESEKTAKMESLSKHSKGESLPNNKEHPLDKNGNNNKNTTNGDVTTQEEMVPMIRRESI